MKFKYGMPYVFQIYGVYKECVPKAYAYALKIEYECHTFIKAHESM